MSVGNAASVDKIFICYRRDDSGDVVDRIEGSLVGEFSRTAIFRDLALPAGVDFRAQIEQELQECKVLLVVIGRDWLGATFPNTDQRRLESSKDHVRFEIELGLTNPRTVVIPVLVRGARMPESEMLPAELQRLAYRNALNVRPNPDFDGDMSRLVQEIRLCVGGASRSPMSPVAPSLSSGNGADEMWKQKQMAAIDEMRDRCRRANWIAAFVLGLALFIWVRDFEFDLSQYQQAKASAHQKGATAGQHDAIIEAKQELQHFTIPLLDLKPPKTYGPLVLVGMCAAVFWYLRTLRLAIYAASLRIIETCRSRLGLSSAQIEDLFPSAPWWLAPVPQFPRRQVMKSDLQGFFGWAQSARVPVGMVLLSAAAIFALYRLGFLASIWGKPAFGGNPLTIGLAWAAAVWGAFQVFAWWCVPRIPEAPKGDVSSVSRRTAIFWAMGMSVAGLYPAFGSSVRAAFGAISQKPRQPRYLTRRRQRAVPDSLPAGRFRGNPASGILFGVCPDESPKRPRDGTVVYCRPLAPDKLPEVTELTGLPLLLPVETPEPAAKSEPRKREARVQLARSSTAFEQAAIARLKAGEAAEACRFLLAGIRHDLRFLKKSRKGVLRPKPSFRLYDFLAVLSVRRSRSAEFDEMRRLIELHAAEFFKDRLSRWTDASSPWSRRWRDLSQPVTWSRLPM